MDEIRQNMIKAAKELRNLAKSTQDPALKVRLLDQAERLQHASQEDSRYETGYGLQCAAC